MAKGDTPPFVMTVEKGPRLGPATASDAERLSTWRVGSTVHVVFTRIGSRVMERKWFAILGLVVERCNVPWKTKEQASEAVKLALGIVNLTKTVGGAWMQYPKSLTELTDPELDEAVRDMMDLITKMTGIDPDTLRRETADVGKDEHEQSGEPTANPTPDSGSGDVIPNDAAPDQSAAADLTEDDDSADRSVGSSSKDARPGTLSPDEKAWMTTLAAVIAAVMKTGTEKDVVDVSKGHARDDLSDTAKQKAKAIVNYGRQVARKEIELADGLDIIAGVAGCEVREIKP